MINTTPLTDALVATRLVVNSNNYDELYNHARNLEHSYRRMQQIVTNLKLALAQLASYDESKQDGKISFDSKNQIQLALTALANAKAEQLALTRWLKKEKPTFSSGVCESLTCGYGKLSDIGYWEFPLYPAEWYLKSLPKDKSK